MTIPFERLGEGNAQNLRKNTQDNTQDEMKNIQDNTQEVLMFKGSDNEKKIERKILTFCVEPKGMNEIL